MGLSKKCEIMRKAGEVLVLGWALGSELGKGWGKTKKDRGLAKEQKRMIIWGKILFDILKQIETIMMNQGIWSTEDFSNFSKKISLKL